MKKTIAVLALIAVLIPSWAQRPASGRIVCDETCRKEYQKTESAEAVAPASKSIHPSSKPKVLSIPTSPAPNPERPETKSPGTMLPAEPLYAVVSPVGRSDMAVINQAPRLETLDGKTVAIVGVSFMTKITHPEIKRLIKENYPSAKVILMDEIGISGPFPAPGIVRKQNEEFKRKLQEMGVDALISGNGRSARRRVLRHNRRGGRLFPQAELDRRAAVCPSDV